MTFRNWSCSFRLLMVRQEVFYTFVYAFSTNFFIYCNLLSTSTIDTEIAVSRLIAKSNASETEKLVFRVECIELFLKKTEKILARSP